MNKQDAHVKLRASIIAECIRVARTAIDINDANYAYQKLENLVGCQEARALFLDAY